MYKFMYSKLIKFVLLTFVNLILLVIFTQTTKACTYNASITGNHLDFEITSDTSTIGLIQYIRRSGNSNITKMYAEDVGSTWIFSDDPYCNVYSSSPLACRQNRGQLGDGAFWIWSVNGDGNFPNHLLPTGIWGLDFDSKPTWDSIGIEYGSTNGQSGDYWHFCTRTGDLNQTTSTPTPSPTLSPTPTPTPTSSPSPTPSLTLSPSPTPTVFVTQIPTPVAVTKVFLIPGLGASWNLDAFASCKDSGYTGEWGIAPYAKDIYQPVLDTLSAKGWNVLPFYYDWRQDIRQNSEKLNGKIISIVNNPEKIDLIGHSMGGLIGRNYIEKYQGAKISKFLAVGTPNKGSTLAYPLFVNGEVWMDDLIQKIGATIFISHCGIPKSTQNLLPTYNYLRDNKSKILNDTSKLVAQNNYLPTDFIAPFWGVKVGTLAGNGYSTLKTLNVSNDRKWPDGKPVGKEFSNDGDGTVLVESVQIPGASNNGVINQSHSGIIASTDGINKILNFLGTPGITDPPYTEPKSALILIGYPGNFWLTDKNGDTTQSKDGMIALIDAKDGDYQLKIVPTSSNTVFIIGQFSKNGQSNYKEYKFKGLNIEPKIITYDSKNPRENILREVKEYDKQHKIYPPFPKIWYEFWKFWNNLHR